MSTLSTSSQQQSRIESLAPWVRAWQLETCQLYWLPVSETPMPFRQKQWLLEFLRRFAPVAACREAQPQTFLQMKSIQPYFRDEFIRSSPSFAPIIGLSRRPGEGLPPMPDKAYADDLAKGRTQYDASSLQPDYTYWFTTGGQQELSAKFLGGGGLTALYLKDDPGSRAPKIEVPKAAYRNPGIAQLLQTHNLDRVNQIGSALGSPFLKKSKLLFGADLKDEPQYPGLLFILPLLSSQDFFQAQPADIDNWFSLFEVYLGESPRDKGVILATRHDIEEELLILLQAMRDEEGAYSY